MVLKVLDGNSNKKYLLQLFESSILEKMPFFTIKNTPPRIRAKLRHSLM